MDRKKELLVRVYTVMVCFVIVAFMILYRVVKVNVVEGDKWRKKNDVYIQWKPINADRGNIYSDDGSLLATSLPFFDIYMDMTRPSSELWSTGIDSLCLLLSQHIKRGLTAREWKSKLRTARDKRNQYFYIGKKLTIDQKDLVKTFPIFDKGQMRGGIIVERYTQREKPFRGLASRTIGIDRDNADNVGLEGYFDKFLTGPTEQRLMKKVPPGVWVPVYDPTESQPQRGNDIVSTINVNMQDVVHNELITAIEKYEAEGGVAILMEVSTGAIKAISNISINKGGYYTENYNTAIGAASEPGSTLKLASAMALIEDGHADLNTLVDVGHGKMKFYDRWMHDSHRHAEQYMSLRNAFEQSSNVGISSAAFNAYGATSRQKDFVDKYVQFGLSEKTGVEIKGEGDPYIKDPEVNAKEWYGTTIPWMAHGYEMKLTPLQVLNFYNTVANGGRMMKPFLVSAIEEDGRVVKAFRPRVVKESIAKPTTIRAAQEMLRGVVLRGTASKLHTEEFSFSGKTGTTRVGYWQEGEKQYNASFAGYFPAESPKYSMIITIYKPNGSYYGSTVAAPVFKRIAEKCFALDLDLIDSKVDVAVVGDVSLPGSHVGYKDDFKSVMQYAHVDYEETSRSKWVTIDPSHDRMKVSTKELEQGKVPDVRGMGARDAVFVLENLGMTVDVAGLGKVSRQSIKPGSDPVGKKIKIFLN